MTRRLPITAVATAVEVACPHCGGEVPAPNGSLFWTTDELRAACDENTARDCPECDEPILMIVPSSVRLTAS